MKRRQHVALAWAAVAAGLVLSVAYCVVGFSHVHAIGGRQLAFDGEDALSAITFVPVGALIAVRRRNPIGWILIVIGLSGGASALNDVIQTSLRSGTSAWQWSTWVQTWVWGPNWTLMITLLLLLFPDGEPPTRRWRWVIPLVWTSIGLQVLGGTLTPDPDPTDVARGYRNPIIQLPHAVDLLLLIGVALVGIAAVASLASIVVRYRRSRGEERLQMKWFVVAGVATALLTYARSIEALKSPVLLGIGLASVVLIPAAIAVSILKYRLYDIDVVINKTVVYAALAVFISAVYVAIVVGIGAAIGQGDRPNLALSILATAVVAAAFQPVRERVQRIANRLVYGKRATPYEVLADFSKRMVATYGTEDLLPQMARILAEGTGASHADVWLKISSELRHEARWPEGNGEVVRRVELYGDDIPALPHSDVSFPVRDRGELLGALAMAKSRGEPVTEADRKLIRDLAAQAGLVLRNVKLIEELRASRQRIVSAQDQERRRLERNIHDGAQQQLVALNVKLGLTRTIAQKDAEKAEALITQLQHETQDALENLRDLARGIYPPLLADQGLAAALQAQARKSAVHVEVHAGGVRRFSQEIEAAVYFSVLEALQNAAKYANASRVDVRLSFDQGALTFEVQDDGSGFDPASTNYGTGLQGIADRLSALDGELEVESAPGSGTKVIGRVPVRALEEVHA